MNAKVVPLRAPTQKPKSFTSEEAVIEELSDRILASGKTYQQIASNCHISISTVANVATRKTRWPRPKTFFALLQYFNLKLTLTTTTTSTN